MLGYPQETCCRFFFFAGARQKISQHVESGEIAIIVLDDLTILFNGGVNLPLREEFLSGLYDLSFFESHKGYYVALNIGSESNVDGGCGTQGSTVVLIRTVFLKVKRPGLR